MDFDLLEKLGKIAGIAGISIGAIVLIFGGIIQKNIFPSLDQKQSFRLIRTMIIASSLLAVLGLVAWIYVENQSNLEEKRSTIISKDIVGTIEDINGSPITSVKVEVAQFPDIIDYSDQTGKFAIEVSGKGSEYIDVVLKHKSYKVFRKKVKVDYESKEKEIILETSILETAYPPEQEEIENRNQPRQNESNQNSNSQTNKQPSSNNTGSTIQLVYAGDDMGCMLNVEINVGGVSIRPTSNSVYLNNVPSGNQSYSITGSIDCGVYGNCTASGSDLINIQNNAKYYVVWMNEDLDAYCDIGLLTEDQYNLLMGY